MGAKKPLWIMIAGPYGSGAKTQTAKDANLKILNEAALKIFRMGHVPIVGVNNAQHLIALAGASGFDEIMMPLSLALSERCDCCLRIGGASKGADEEVARFRARGKPVYFSIEEIG